MKGRSGNGAAFFFAALVSPNVNALNRETQASNLLLKCLDHRHAIDIENIDLSIFKEDAHRIRTIAFGVAQF
jgi:hypothetical protein